MCKKLLLVGKFCFFHIETVILFNVPLKDKRTHIQNLNVKVFLI